MADTESFAVWVRRARKELDLSQRELAQRVGCAVVTIQKIEEGRRRPSREIAELLCRWLEITPEDRPRFLKVARAARPTGLPSPEAASLQAVLPGNLPTPAAPFIGRARDLESLHRLIHDPTVRVITLAGPPGVGKTRLSIESAAHARGFADGVWFVPLAPLQDPGLVVSTIGHVLGIANAGPEELILLLRGRSMLLVLDNCEHVLPAMPDVAALVSGCAGLKLVATSRAPLRIYGENLFRVEPLSLPSEPTAAATGSPAPDAVALFMARASSVSPGLALTPANAQQVAVLCTQLGGLPLAIELAAAGLYHQSLDELTDAITCCGQPLAALQDAPRDFDDRHQSLANALAWSYNLLSQPARRVYRSLGVFRGGFAPLAASAVAALGAGDPSIGDVLGELVQHSLLTQEGWVSGGRLAMLEVMRADAQERCRAEGDLDEVRARHAGLFVERMAAIDWYGAGLDRGLGEARADADNLRAALEWLISQGDGGRALRLCTALRLYWEFDGYQREGQAWLARALVLPETAAPLVRARAYLDGCVLAFQTGDYTTAEAWGEASLRLFTAAGETASAALAELTLGRVAIEQGCYSQAETREERALSLYRSVADDHGAAGALMHLADAALGRGDDAAASELAEASLALTRSLGGAFWDAITHLVLFEVALRAGRLGDAHDHLLSSLEAGTAFHAIRPLTLALALSAALAAHLPGAAEERACQAARLWGAAIELRLARGLAFSEGHRQRLDAYLSGARALLGPQAWQREEQQSRHLSLEDAVALGRSIGHDDAAAKTTS